MMKRKIHPKRLSLMKSKSLEGIVILDAPGISGMGRMNFVRFAAYVEAGGPVLHPVYPSEEHRRLVADAANAANLAVKRFLDDGELPDFINQVCVGQEQAERATPEMRWSPLPMGVLYADDRYPA